MRIKGVLGYLLCVVLLMGAASGCALTKGPGSAAWSKQVEDYRFKAQRPAASKLELASALTEEALVSSREPITNALIAASCAGEANNARTLLDSNTPPQEMSAVHGALIEWSELTHDYALNAALYCKDGDDQALRKANALRPQVEAAKRRYNRAIDSFTTEYAKQL